MHNVLNEANRIVAYFENIEKQNGVNFNLFSILDRDSDEEKTHSALIAELLNPKGTHGQGNKFLLLFIETLSQKRETSAFWKNAEIPNLDHMNNTQIYTERNVGKYRNKESRLDILLLNNEWHIVIENKFNAKQGNEQLERYLDYINEDASRKKLLIYLTKFGEKYKSKELSNGIDYFCITYKRDIINWLEKCKNSCETIPILYQSIIQYINLIKKETNQTINQEMKTEIQKLILNSGIKGTIEIVRNYEQVAGLLTSELQDRLIDKLKCIPELQNIRKQEDPFYSVFLSVNNRTIGIESFNLIKKSHRKNSLFIGELDFNRKSDPKNLIHSFWLKKSIEIIWDENEKLAKMNEFGKDEENKEGIILELVDYVNSYIKRIIKD